MAHLNVSNVSAGEARSAGWTQGGRGGHEGHDRRVTSPQWTLLPSNSEDHH